MRSLGNRLALLFFAITLLAIGALYAYVVPGLGTRLLNEKLTQLASAARLDSGPIVAAIGRSKPGLLRARLGSAGARSGDRVTLLSLARPGGPAQSLRQSDTSDALAPGAPGSRVAGRALRTGSLSTGAESPLSGAVGEAAYPVSRHRRVAAVIVYSAPASGILSDVAIVRREIFAGGGIALLVAFAGGYLVARALAQRVKRLERAAEQVAAGDFEHTIPVESSDELGQLAVAFNDMQLQFAQLESARKKFIATASHELRTPVFSLGGFVELLEDEDLDAETRRRFLNQVKGQVERLRKLSVDLLDLSRLEAGALELRPEHVDLGELTRSVSGEFEPALAQHDSHLELRLAGDRIEALCDPVRVAQIMRILIDNAITHTPAGTRISVTAGRGDGCARLAVRDGGEGIDRFAMGRIFEPFYTADGAQGSGLGLAIASELADRMAGGLSVRSEPGSTVFTLKLPA